ncbi:SET domain-containing protein [Fusarium heterosporum]|uniref:SET domain-containing protein n=1 Tax=Fusarium heterosporum TaxID=42747 RepID=A0A8H5WVQ6_FUSHE|nr:SET domain-containing protein [Fusarium heterosporum]
MPDTNPFFVLKDIPGKDKGLIAIKNIPKGTRILAETPLFTIPQHYAHRDESGRRIKAELKKLSKTQQQAFMSLHNSHPHLSREIGVVETNGFGLGPDTSTCALFLEAARMNHSCAPNVSYRWNSNIGKMTVHATKDIQDNSEITINYLGEIDGYAVRQQKLKTAFGFDCACDLCSLPVSARKLSDKRRSEIKKLEKSLDVEVDMSVGTSPLKVFINVRKLLYLLKSEDITDRLLPRCHDSAFHAAVAHQDLARAKVFAERSLEIWSVFEGFDSPKAQQLQSLLDNPDQYYFAAMSGQWRTAVEDVPKGLGQVDFESWLWREEDCAKSEPTGLRDNAAFPLFQNLPWDNELNLDYYRSKGGDIYEPRKHWAFLGEITNVEAISQVRMTVKDKSGKHVPLSFYADLPGSNITPSMVRVGHTVVILYAAKHRFSNMTIGIRNKEGGVLNVCIIRGG